MTEHVGGVRLAERLSGKKILLTGVTGFVGEALLHRLLTQAPDTLVAVLVRAQGAASATDRVKTMLAKPIFADVVESSGGVDELVESRLDVLEGDLASVPRLPGDAAAVVHCAGDVSFDPPVDQAFTTNIVGTRNLLARVAEIGPHVHYVHISTAYVAGRRRGLVAERRVEHDVDLESELVWGLAQHQIIENRSRTSQKLAELREAAEKEHGRAGPMTAASATEERRRAWVHDELVRTGAERARSLGWTDCYTFTKALGERVVEAHAATSPVTILRPSIIESALDTPHPGWIEGFKMAEPLILAYGRGELPEFPAAPDLVVDIVPVDQVVAAIVAALGETPEPGQPRWYHVSSSARNPLSFVHLYAIVRGYFDRFPFDMGGRGAVRLPEWRFPGAQQVQRLLITSERAYQAADYLVTHAPRHDRTRDLARKLETQRRRLEFLRRYLDLYWEYSQAELAFSDQNTMELFASLHPADRVAFCFDTSVIDWDHYLGAVHIAAVTEPLRQYDVVRRARQAAPASGPRALGPPDGSEHQIAALFDMDGTLLSSNVIETYLWMRLQDLDPAERLSEVGRAAARLPGLVRAERRERGAFLRLVYREYAGARLVDLEEIADRVLSGHVLARLSPGAVRRVREHRAAGHRTVLITGAIAPLTRPLQPLFDHIEAARLSVDSRGVCTGFLDNPPLVGESRAAWLHAYARANDLDLGRSFAYADSHSDLPMLLAVGNPVAVQPDVTLYRQAKKSRWPIVDWSTAGAVSRVLAPTGDRA